MLNFRELLERGECFLEFARSKYVKVCRFGYPGGIFERQKFLQSLFDQLKGKERILVKKRVTKVKHGSNSVSVICTDGTEYVGDIVVGADGIHSLVRQEMQNISEETSPGLMDQDRECIGAEYNCIFGTSAPISSIRKTFNCCRSTSCAPM